MTIAKSPAKVLAEFKKQIRAAFIAQNIRPKDVVTQPIETDRPFEIYVGGSLVFDRKRRAQYHLTLHIQDGKIVELDYDPPRLTNLFEHTNATVWLSRGMTVPAQKLFAQRLETAETANTEYMQALHKVEEFNNDVLAALTAFVNQNKKEDE